MPRMSQNVVSRGRVRTWSGAVVGLLGVVALTGTAYAQTGNVVTDFNYLNTTNPAVSGTWSYGQVTSLAAFNAGGYVLSVYGVADTNYLGATGLNGRSTVANNVPGVAKNTTASTINFSTVNVPTDHLFLHPGSAGEVTVVRFTATTAGSFSFNGDFKALDTVGTSTRGTIKQNTTTTLFSAAVNGAFNSANSTPAFGLAGITLGVGDTIDFSVDYANGSYSNDSTGLAVTESFAGAAAAPEPGSLMLIVPGALGVLGLVRRRKTS